MQQPKVMCSNGSSGKLMWDVNHSDRYECTIDPEMKPCEVVSYIIE